MGWPLDTHARRKIGDKVTHACPLSGGGLPGSTSTPLRYKLARLPPDHQRPAGSGLSPHRLRHPEGSGLLGDRTHLSDEGGLLLLRDVRHCDVDDSPKHTDELALVQNQVPLTYVKERTSGSNPIGLGVR